MDYIEQKSKALLKEFEQTDASEDEVISLGDVQEKLARLQRHKIKYEALQKLLDYSQEPQVSNTDPDANALLVRRVVVEVGYNVQATVDQDHKLVVATHTINRNDKNALYAISKEAKENIPVDKLTVLADKGYHSGMNYKPVKKPM